MNNDDFQLPVSVMFNSVDSYSIYRGIRYAIRERKSDALGSSVTHSAFILLPVEVAGLFPDSPHEWNGDIELGISIFWINQLPVGTRIEIRSQILDELRGDVHELLDYIFDDYAPRIYAQASDTVKAYQDFVLGNLEYYPEDDITQDRSGWSLRSDRWENDNESD